MLGIASPDSAVWGGIGFGLGKIGPIPSESAAHLPRSLLVKIFGAHEPGKARKRPLPPLPPVRAPPPWRLLRRRRLW